SDYARALEDYVARVAGKISHSAATLDEADARDARFRPVPTHSTGDLASLRDVFKRLPAAVKSLQGAAKKFDTRATKLAQRAGHDIPWWKWLSNAKPYHEIRRVNEKLKFFERQFLYEKGLDGRNWFKHVVFA